jgi:hypothetical protein
VAGDSTELRSEGQEMFGNFFLLPEIFIYFGYFDQLERVEATQFACVR